MSTMPSPLSTASVHPQAHPRPIRDSSLDTEEYLSVHFRDHCNLSTLARQVGSSSNHLSRMFKQVTGESLSRRRMRLRLAGALSEILDGADDLARVAVESGFYDHSYMTNSFRSHFGITPKEAKVEATSRVNPDVNTRIVERPQPVFSRPRAIDW